jgi:hypothetical protein
MLVDYKVTRSEYRGIRADITTTMASCFDRCAYYRHVGIIDHRQYFANAIAHFHGGYHHDGCPGGKLEDGILRGIDPLGSSREMALKTEFPPLDDTGM